MFEIVTGIDPQVLLVHVRGDLDIATVDSTRADLERTLLAALDAASAKSGRPSLVVFDLRGLTIMSAAGLHMLGELAVDLNHGGVTTTVAVEPDSLARRLLRLAGLDQRLIVLAAPLPPARPREVPAE